MYKGVPAPKRLKVTGDATEFVKKEMPKKLQIMDQDDEATRRGVRRDPSDSYHVLNSVPVHKKLSHCLKRTAVIAVAVPSDAHTTARLRCAFTRLLL